MKRRTFIQQSCATLGLGLLGSAPLMLLSKPLYGNTGKHFQKPLIIPPLLDYITDKQGVKRFTLSAGRGESRLIKEFTTPTMGYNGSYLGPTIRVRNGEKVHFTVNNLLDQTTTLHWHGLHVPAEFDGGPRQPILAGKSWEPEFTIRQPAATLWYHPHAMGSTGEQVYQGLAGMFYIDDKTTDSLVLPNDYGVNDFPIILQDRRFYESGKLAYVRSMMDVMHGVIGNIMLVNGAEAPVLKVPAGLVRLRILNGSNSSIYRIQLPETTTMVMIATDGGFLERPVAMGELLLSPGERAEVLVDFGNHIPGDRVRLLVDLQMRHRIEAMEFHVGRPPQQRISIPEKLAEIDWIDEKEAVRTRKFIMQTFSKGGRLTINNKHMDMARIDETVKLGTAEIWEISNISEHMMQMIHSMHLHDVQFQILDRNGVVPKPHEKGRKDTVMIWPNETVRIIARFENYRGIYMYHCHLLEHEDAGMMGQFEVR